MGRGGPQGRTPEGNGWGRFFAVVHDGLLLLSTRKLAMPGDEIGVAGRCLRRGSRLQPVLLGGYEVL